MTRRLDQGTQEAASPRIKRVRGVLVASTSLVGLAAVTFLLARVSTTFFRVDGGPSALWWPPVGIALAIIVRLPRRSWAAHFAAFALGLVAANDVFFDTAGTAITAAFNTIELIVACFALTDRYRPGVRRLGNPRGAIRFGAILTAAMALVTPLFAWAQWPAFTTVAWHETAISYVLGHLLSVLSLAPLLLPATGSGRRMIRPAESIVIGTVVIAVDWWAYTAADVEHGRYIVLLPLIWAASRLSVTQATIASTVTAAIAAHGAVADSGVFALDGTVATRQLSAQLFIAAITVTTLALVLMSRRREYLTTVAADREKALRQALDTSPLPTATVDLAGVPGTILAANDALCDLVGWHSNELVGRHLALLVPAIGEDGRIDELEAGLAAAGRAAMRRSSALITRNGDTRPVEIVATKVDPALAPSFALVYVYDLTAIEREKATLRAAAATDPLTGLANRTALMDALSATATSLTTDPGHRAGMLYIDLDGFKAINDTHGHTAGDEVLAATARRIGQVVRPSDTVARLGGDEFVVLARPITTTADLAEIADRIRDATTRPIRTDHGPVRIGCSIGWSVINRAEPATTALARADAVMYREKTRHHAATTGPVADPAITRCVRSPRTPGVAGANGAEPGPS